MEGTPYTLNPYALEWIQLIMRVLSTLALFPACYEAWKVASLLKNSSFSRLLKNIAFGLLFFIGLRLAGTTLDEFIKLQLPLSAYIVNFGFWGWVAYYFRQQRLKIASSDLGELGRQKISESIDEIINEMKLAHRDLKVMSDKNLITTSKL